MSDRRNAMLRDDMAVFDAILAKAEKISGLSRSAILSGRRDPATAQVRQAVVWALRRRTGLLAKQIAGLVGRRESTYTSTAAHFVEKRRRTDKETKRLTAALGRI